MLRLTFTDSKNQTKVIGEADNLEELYGVLQAHANRLFIHPAINHPPRDIAENKGWYIMGHTKNGCRYMVENLGNEKTANAAGCNVCNAI